MIGKKWQVIVVSILLLASIACGTLEYTGPLDDLSSDFLVDGGAITGLVSATDGTASWLDNSLSDFTLISGIDITATDTVTGVILTDGTFIVTGGVVVAGTWQGSTIVVSYGGTGATTLTDGGILLGSGTSAVTALAVASNGQIPIGDGATDPVLATITGSSGVIVTNGPGTITLDVNDTGVDHGGLTGLGDDDHTIYLLADGTRDLAGDWTISANSITLTLGTLTAEQLTSTDDLNVTGTGTFGDIIVDNLSIDGFTITSTTNLVIDANGGNSDARIEADDDIYLQANDFVYIQPSADVADYIALRTLIGVPEITTVGNCDLRISASSGEIDFRDENLTTTGHLQAANFTTDEVTNNTVFVGDDSGGSGTNNVYVGEHAGENATSNLGVGVGNYVLQNNTGSNPVASGFSTGQDNTGDYLTSDGYAAAQRNKGHRLTVSGGFAAQENLGNDVTLGGYLGGQYNTENNFTGMGGNVGQWNTGENPSFFGGNTGRWNDSDNATSVGYNSFNLWTDDTPAAETFNNTAIDDVNDRITITTHGFGATNSYTNLMYDEGTSSIPGLTDGVIYQWKIINANLIELRIGDITDAGSGTGHIFTPKVCYANSSAFGYDAEPDAANQIMLGDGNVTQVKTAGTFAGTGLTLGDGSATDIVIHFDASAYDANIIFDESDNEFDFEDSNITTSGNLSAARTLMEYGSAAAPTYSFANNTGTGLYSSDGTTFNIVLSGAARYQINASGNIIYGYLYPSNDNARALGDNTHRWNTLRVGTGLSSFAGDVSILADNKFLSLGVTNTDLRISSDGTNGIITPGTALRIGTDANHLSISNTGVVTLAGDAKRHLTLRPDLDYTTITAQGKPTRITYGAYQAFSLPTFAADEELFFNINIPGRWDGTSDITMDVLVFITANEDINDDFKLQLSWANTEPNEPILNTTTDVPVETNLLAGRVTAYDVYNIEFTIDYDADAGNPVEDHDDLALRLRRLAADGTEIAGEVAVLDYHLHFQVDKMFQAPE